MDTDFVQQFREGYVEGIAKVLELGVSKLEQVYRLPESTAYSGLLAGGNLAIAEEIIPMHDISFSELRSAVSHETAKNEKKPKTSAKNTSPFSATVKQIETLIATLAQHKGSLKPSQEKKIEALSAALAQIVSAD